MSGWVTGAAIVGGAAIGYLGNQQMANAASGAADAQLGATNQMRRDVLGQAGLNQRDAMALAEATPQELAALDRSYKSAMTNLDRQDRLLAAIDPALMEASKQALGLLRGESTSANNPLINQRNAQRQQLVSSLRAQYGPGAESSSIGQRALQQFDMESNTMFQQNQQSSLAQMFGIAGTDFNANGQRAISGLQQVGQGYSALQERKLSTRMNLGAQTMGALSGTSQAAIQAAGAPYVGASLQGQGIASLGNSFMNTGAYLGSSGAFNRAPSAAAPTPTAAPTTMPSMNTAAAPAYAGTGGFNAFYDGVPKGTGI